MSEGGKNGNGHEVAVWAGIAAFFGSLLAIGVFDALNPAEWLQWFGAIIVAGITAASVYAKQRLEDARERQRKLSPKD